MLYDPMLLVSRFCDAQRKLFNETRILDQSLHVLIERSDGSTSFIRVNDADPLFGSENAHLNLRMFTMKTLSEELYFPDSGGCGTIIGVLLTTLDRVMISGEDQDPQVDIPLPSLVFNYTSRHAMSLGMSLIESTSGKAEQPVNFVFTAPVSIGTPQIDEPVNLTANNILMPIEASRHKH